MGKVEIGVAGEDFSAKMRGESGKKIGKSKIQGPQNKKSSELITKQDLNTWGDFIWI